MRRLQLLVIIATFIGNGPTLAGTLVEFPNLPGRQPGHLIGYLARPGAGLSALIGTTPGDAVPYPAVVVLHGCGGPAAGGEGSRRDLAYRLGSRPRWQMLRRGRPRRGSHRLRPPRHLLQFFATRRPTPALRGVNLGLSIQAGLPHRPRNLSEHSSHIRRGRRLCWPSPRRPRQDGAAPAANGYGHPYGAEVAVSRQMFVEILSLIARLRAPPAPA